MGCTDRRSTQAITHKPAEWASLTEREAIGSHQQGCSGSRHSRKEGCKGKASHRTLQQGSNTHFVRGMSLQHSQGAWDCLTCLLENQTTLLVLHRHGLERCGVAARPTAKVQNAPQCKKTGSLQWYANCVRCRATCWTCLHHPATSRMQKLPSCHNSLVGSEQSVMSIHDISYCERQCPDYSMRGTQQDGSNQSWPLLPIVKLSCKYAQRQATAQKYGIQRPHY